MNVIEIENVSKQYRLGKIGTGTLSHDLNRWWYRVRGKEDPYLKIGVVNDRTKTSNKYDYVWALRDINFSVSQGDVLGIIGKNGAGKSTLLKILSRVTTPSTGIIRARGRIASLLEVGTGFHDEMTGRENIFMNGTIMGMNKTEISRKLDEIVDFSGVAMYLDTPVKRYSSGMKVRLGFAVAAFLEPEILVVDEVLAVGDAEFQKKAIGKMQDVSSGEGRTVLFVSHNMMAVRNLCKTGLVLDDGMMSFSGTAEQAIDFYLKGIEEKVSTNIDEICKRKGNGMVRFSKVSFHDAKGVVKNAFEVGEDLIIKVFYQKADNIMSMSAFRINVSINNVMSTRVAWLSSKIFTDNYSSSDNCIQFHVKNLPLLQGIYNLNLHAECEVGVVDFVKEIAMFTVTLGDYYHTGRDIPVNLGQVVLNYSVE